MNSHLMWWLRNRTSNCERCLWRMCWFKLTVDYHISCTMSRVSLKGFQRWVRRSLARKRWSVNDLWGSLSSDRFTGSSLEKNSCDCRNVISWIRWIWSNSVTFRKSNRRSAKNRKHLEFYCIMLWIYRLIGSLVRRKQAHMSRCFGVEWVIFSRFSTAFRVLRWMHLLVLRIQMRILKIYLRRIKSMQKYSIACYAIWIWLDERYFRMEIRKNLR